MSVLLRPATHHDVPALLAIESESFARPNWVAHDFLRYPCTVAEFDGEVAGFLVVRQTYGGDAHARAEREILNVAVAPRFRRTGIATLLMRNELQSGLIYFLEVRESNVPAQSLYRQLGFREISRRPKYYRHPSETAIVMQVK